MGLPNILFNLAKRIRYPTLASATDDIAEEGARIAFSGDSSVAGWDGATPLVKWFRDTSKDVGTFWGKIGQQWHTPEMISDNEAWQEIVKTGSNALLARGRFASPILSRLKVAQGGLRKETPESARIFDALQEPGLASRLSKEERSLYEFQKENYDFLFHERLKTLTGSQQAYNDVLKMSKRGVTEAELKILPDNIKEAVDLASRKIKDYAPHFWNRDETIDLLQNRLSELAAKYGRIVDPEKKKTILATIREYEKSLTNLSGGSPLTWEGLPGEFLFKHELVRKGAEGFKHDAVKAFNNYLHGYARKTFDEPAIRRMVQLFDELPFELRPYAKKWIRDFGGYNQRSVMDDMASWITSFEYLRTLGLNFRSPIGNLLQQFNTVVDAGPINSMKGWARMFTKEGRDLWDKSGLGIEVPATLTEELSPSAGSVEKLRRVLGFFFNTAEKANRRHALNAYMAKFEPFIDAGKMTYDDAFQKAIDGVHKTQFQYGKIGMPQVLRGPAGRVGLQYWSYPIKQFEFYQKLWRENPAKWVAMVGGAMGINVSFAELLGLDLSNYLGFGANLSEAMEMVRSASKGELEEAFAHGRLTFAQGTGMLPSGPGPAVTSLLDFVGKISKGEKIGESFLKQFKPVQWERVEKLLGSIANRNLAREGHLPIMKDKEFVSEEPAWKTFTQTFGPKFTSRSKKEAEWFKQSTLDVLDGKRKRLIAEAIADGDGEKADKLIARWQVIPSRDTIYEILLERELPRELRKKYIKRGQRQELREER